MCLMLPVKIAAIEGEWAVLDGTTPPRASLLLEPDAQPGDWVLVAGGSVVRRLDPDQAAEMAAALRIANDPSPDRLEAPTS